jgi:NADH:ubiquinone oxidoreductase subunit 5 (subunit L)/multisubunit Na+/H+ antiporter MnhA subunit
MDNLIFLMVLYPFLGFFISLFFPENNEKVISRFSFFIMFSSNIQVLLFLIAWALGGFKNIEQNFLTVYQTEHHTFILSFLFTKTTAVFMLIGTFLVYLVTVYSRYYLHKEKGFKRFFSALLFFYFGYSLVTLSGNLFTLFAGWEALGISSFFLIAFYRNRYLPVRNAVKVFSVYRLGDVGILLALWMNHHLWERDIAFSDYYNLQEIQKVIHHHPLESLFVASMILLAAAAKSAQLPFSSWLPRAMEGPTPSSAIFYGSLSVNLGVLLLMKTYLFWSSIYLFKWIILLLGFFTSLLAASMVQVQCSIKSQIAYASITQIGIIFIEMALGFENLALLHFAGNAFLRTYQLLISPSVVSYLIREQFYYFPLRQFPLEGILSNKLLNTLYVLSLKEWNLANFLFQIYWLPLKKLGNSFKFLNVIHLLLLGLLLIVLPALVYSKAFILSNQLSYALAVVYALIALVFVLRSFVERHKARISWVYLVVGNILVSLSPPFISNFNFDYFLLYNSGIIVCGIAGYWVLDSLRHKEHGLDLEQFNGHAYEHPYLSMAFFVVGLGVFGFPITPTFIGIDLNLSLLAHNQYLLVALLILCYLVTGLSVIRLYSRVFLGPHIKTYHEQAYHSS